MRRASVAPRCEQTSTLYHFGGFIEIRMSPVYPCLNRTPIVGLKKIRFDDRRCGSFACVRIEGDVTTTGSGARRWSSSRPEPARTRSPDGCHTGVYREKPDQAVQVRRRGGGHGRQRQQTLRLGDEGRRGARPRRERHDQDGGHGQIRDREHRAVGALVPRIPGGRPGGAASQAQGTAEGREIQTETCVLSSAGVPFYRGWLSGLPVNCLPGYRRLVSSGFGCFVIA